MSDTAEPDLDALWAALPDSEGRDRGDILIQLCYLLEQSHDHETSFACAQEAAEVFGAVGALRDRGIALYSVAGGLANSYDYLKAIETYGEARDLLTAHGEPTDLLPVLEGLGHAHRFLQQWDKSLEVFIELDKVMMVHDYTAQGSAASDHRLAVTYQHLGGHDDLVLHHMQQAVDHGAGHFSTHWVCEARDALGFAQHRQGRDDLAVATLEKNLAVARTCTCTTCLSSALGALANVLGTMGERDKADAFYLEAIEAAKQKSNGAPVELDAEYALFRAEGAETISEGAKLVDQARAIFETIGEPAGAILCDYTMGDLWLRAGEPAEALAAYQAAAEAVSAYDPARGTHELARNTAAAMIAMGNAKACLASLAANGWVEDEGPITSRDRALHVALYCEALVAAGNRTVALRHAERLITAIAEQPWPGIAGRAQWVRAQALQHRDPAGCERAAQRAMALLLTAGDYELATTIGTQFFIEPYETLAKIDIDNEARAEAQAEERQLREDAETLRQMEIVAATALADPIEEQVTRPSAESGAA